MILATTETYFNNQFRLEFNDIIDRKKRNKTILLQ